MRIFSFKENSVVTINTIDGKQFIGRIKSRDESEIILVPQVPLRKLTKVSDDPEKGKEIKCCNCDKHFTRKCENCDGCDFCDFYSEWKCKQCVTQKRDGCGGCTACGLCYTFPMTIDKKGASEIYISMAHIVSWEFTDYTVTFENLGTQAFVKSKPLHISVFDKENHCRDNHQEE